jgi:flagellar hook-associated protein 2
MAVTRISGLASGMDTEAIIEVLVEARQVPITSLEDKVDEDNDKYTAWSELDEKLTSLNSTVTDLTDYSTWNQKAASSSDTDVFDASASASSSALNGIYDISISQLATAATQTSANQSSIVSSATEALGLSGTFDVNGQTITFDAEDTLSSIASMINDASADMTDGVVAYTVGTTLLVKSDTTGLSSTLTIDNITGDDLFSGGTSTAGQDLAGEIDGISVSSSTNTDITSFISGVTLNFYDDTVDSGNVKLTVENDTETIKSLLNDFIEEYNDTMALAKTQGTVNLSSQGDVSALGVLQGDSLLASIQTDARSILSSLESDSYYFNQDFNSLYSVGIWFESQDNKLSIVDEDKLDDALKNNFDDVKALFRNVGEADGEGDGIFRQFGDFLYRQIDPVEGNVVNRENTLQDDISEKDKRIDEMYNDLIDYEADLWEHYAWMEDYVSTVQAQMNYVMSALGVSS